MEESLEKLELEPNTVAERLRLTGMRRREDSTSFSEGIIRCRHRSERKQPWFQAMPVRQVIPTMYRALSSSTHLQPFQLISLGKTLLGFLRQQTELSEMFGISNVLDWQSQNYLEILDGIITRLLTMQLDEGDDVQELLDTVWDSHKKGAIDFSKTTIPEKLVQVCPLRLEQVLQSCLTSSSSDSASIDLTEASPGPLVPLCERSPENFLKVMECLQNKFARSTDSVIRQKITDFALNLIEHLKSKLGKEYFILYPSPFQPLLNFMSAILQNNASKKILQHASVMDEVLSLLDNLYYQSELMKLDITTVTFMLCTLPKVSYVLSRRKSCDIILYRRWPWLKRVVKTDEFAQSFDCN